MSGRILDKKPKRLLPYHNQVVRCKQLHREEYFVNLSRSSALKPINILLHTPKFLY